jgi:hypothetical protein
VARTRISLALNPGYARIAKAGMADMSKKFIDMGAEVYVDRAAVVKEANKAL